MLIAIQSNAVGLSLHVKHRMQLLKSLSYNA